MRVARHAVAVALLAWGAAAAGAPIGGDYRFIEVPGETKRFVVNAGAQSIAFGAAGAQIRFARAQAKSSPAAPSLAIEFDAANAVAPQGIDASPVRYHWIVGDRASWLTDLASYRAIVYRGVWPGVDATWHGDRAGLKYDFTVQPGFDPARVALRITGAEDARITAEGALEWKSGDLWQRDERPLAWQQAPGGVEAVRAAYKLEKIAAGSWKVTFDLGDYDRARALIVDPAWSAFAGLVGGNAADQVYAIARQSDGSTLACGVTSSLDLPVTSGYTAYPGAADNAFMVRFNAAGAPQFVTYLGGNGYDVCTGIAIDAGGSIYVTGGTTSTNFPFAGSGDANFRRSKAASDRDAFVAKFGSDGKTLAYSGVIGGSAEDQANAIAVDSSGRAYVTGYASAGFPAVVGPVLTIGAGMDAFVARVAANGGSLEYSGFLGGNGGVEAGRGIAVNGAAEAIVVGETDSTSGLPVAGTVFRSNAGNGDGDGFVARLNSNGSLSFFTLLLGTAGTGTGADRALAVAMDPADGTITVVGETDSTNFPANNAGVRQGSGPQNALAGNMDGFIVRLAANGSAVLSATYIGGASFDTAEAVAYDGSDGIFVTGSSSSPGAGFPTVATAGLSTSRFGMQDGFIAKILKSATAAFSYSGFVGANVGVGASAANDAMHAIAVTGSSGIVSVGGATGAPSVAQITGSTSGALAGAVSPTGVVLRINPNPNALVVVSGTPQSTRVSTAFAAPLVVKVQDQDGNALANYSVTFTPPATGARATLSPSVPVLTNSLGMAQASATANATVGTYNVQASVAGLTSVNFALTNQFVASVALSSSASSVSQGTSVTFTATVTGSTPTGTVTFREGGTVLCNAVALSGTTAQCATSTLPPGVRSITADYSGDTLNTSATSAPVNVTVRAPQAITFATLPDRIFGTPPFNVSATGGASGNPVTFTSSTTGVCSTGGTNGATVTLLAIGQCTINANQAGSTLYDPAPQVARSFMVLRQALRADFNNDNKPDLIWSNASSGATYIWFMNGRTLGSDQLLAVIDPSWQLVGVGDFNRDGHLDVVWRNGANGDAYVWYLVNGVFQSDAFLFTVDPQWLLAGVADFNLDGSPDLLMRHATSGGAFVWFFDNVTPIGDQFLFSIDPSWKVENIGDFNVDGKPDLLFRNMGSGLAFAWYTEYSGGSVSLAGSSPSMFSIDPAWEVVQVADWNADGKVDLLFRNTGSGIVFVWYLNGTTLGGSDYITQIDPVWRIVPRR